MAGRRGSADDKLLVAGFFIDACRVDVAPITFFDGGQSRTGNAIVSLAGRSNDGTWLPILKGTQTPAVTVYAT